jgi:5-formyltetrahydrofolate cyclo-ligase
MSDFALEAERSKAAKVALRSRLLTAREELPEAVRRSASASVQASTLALVRRERPTLCAAYVPVGGEPGGSALPDLLAGALPPGGRLILPVLLPSKDLDWAVYDGELTDGPYGLRQPPGVRLGVEVVSKAGLILVPALAVDRTGHRLGRGGGSYDRALVRAGSALTAALLHDGERLDVVPAEPHDRPVHGAITPAGGWVTLKAAPGWTK